MKLFRRSRSGDSFGAIVDIGSGSVLVAIVHSSPASSHPHIVWSHREHAPLKNIDSLEQSAKAVMTALVNASMLLDAHGREALRTYNESARLTHMQCSIAAPWSYTVTKTLNYTQEQPFIVTKELIAELTHTVQEKIADELKASEPLQQLGLQIIDRMPMDMLTNGYRVDDPEGEEATAFTLAHSNTVTQQHIIEAVNEMQDKLLSNTKLTITSFALMFHIVSRELFPDIFDTCLIDITYEATEIGIMRDGILTHCTHTPFGIFSLVREISAATNLPLAEVHGHLQTPNLTAFTNQLSSSQQADVEAIFEAYTKRIADLFLETGDDLSIPKHITLHTELTTEPLFSSIIDNAVKRTIKSTPIIQPITKQIVTKLYKPATEGSSTNTPKDTALLLSAQFFHMKRRG